MKLKKIMAGTMVATLLMTQSIFAGTTLTVNGNYEQKSAPDSAEISFDIYGSGKTAIESSAAASASLSKIIEKLVASGKGVTKDDITISYQSTYEEYDYVPVEPVAETTEATEETKEAFVSDFYYPEETYDVVGYKTNYTIKVKVDSIANVEKVYDLILDTAGDISYSYVNYTLTNDDEAYYTALEKAVEKALEKADKMGEKFFGGKKYTVKSINETGYNYSYSDYYGSMVRSSKEFDVTQYLPEVTTSGDVSVVVEFED